MFGAVLAMGLFGVIGYCFSKLCDYFCRTPSNSTSYVTTEYGTSTERHTIQNYQQEEQKYLTKLEYPTKNNYVEFFRNLLRIEEAETLSIVESYNMKSVTILCILEDTLELRVSGLAEKRPSLMVGDKVQARVHGELKDYEGVICQTTNDTIKIKGFHRSFICIVKENPRVQVDAKFNIGRLPYERMETAVRLAVTCGFLPVIFPENVWPTSQHQFNITESETSGIAPFILFGPPGTGKTMTIIETILQIFKIWGKQPRLLVCAPSNAACDMLAGKLVPYFHQHELLRLHSQALDKESIPEEVLEYSNLKNDARYKAADLMQFKIVICSLIMAGRYANSVYNPTHVFIDEAAQAKEPETMVAIAGLIRPGNQIVLAGDPYQLGPVCTSKEALKKGLGTSLLKRLMEMEVYKNNTNMRIKLLQNYRSHEQILRIPNKLFYEEELRFLPNNDPLVQYDVLSDKELKHEHATVFHATMSKEKQDDKSPSYFNVREIQLVLEYVDALLHLQNISQKVLQNEIRIISPYKAQVCRIKNCLDKRGYKQIEVGTTEVFQGREKRVIIVSIVRSQRNRLGFVEDPERFNVAITRAKSKCIVIGNPLCMLMERDEVQKWTMYIDQCEKLGSIRGTPYKRRTADGHKDSIQKSEKGRLRKKTRSIHRQ